MNLRCAAAVFVFLFAAIGLGVTALPATAPDRAYSYETTTNTRAPYEAVPADEPSLALATALLIVGAATIGRAFFGPTTRLPDLALSSRPS